MNPPCKVGRIHEAYVTELPPMTMIPPGAGRPLRWRLEGHIVFKLVNISGFHFFFVVPKGFYTDLTSKPSISFLPKEGTWTIASILHDWLHVRDGMTQAEVDSIYRQVMGIAGTGFFTRWEHWLAVRIGGRRAWVRNRKLQNNAARQELFAISDSLQNTAAFIGACCFFPITNLAGKIYADPIG